MEHSKNRCLQVNLNLSRSEEAENTSDHKTEPIPDRTWTEIKDENDCQMKILFEGDDLSYLCDNPRRQRSRGYTSIDELLSNEFSPDKKTDLYQMENGEVITGPSVVGMISPFCDLTAQFQEKEYKMVLRELDNTPNNKLRNRTKDLVYQKNRATRRVKKTISQYEFSKRLLHQSISSQLKTLNIDSESHSIISIGKHLYSSNINGKLRLNLGGGSQTNQGVVPFSRPFKKLQEWRKCQEAEQIVKKDYHLLVQQSCSESFNSDSLSINKSVNYLTFLEEGYIINLMVCQNSMNSWVNRFELYSVSPKTDRISQGIASAFTSIKSLVGGDIRLCDLIGFLRNKIKEVSQNSQLGQSFPTVGCSLRSP